MMCKFRQLTEASDRPGWAWFSCVHCGRRARSPHAAERIYAVCRHTGPGDYLALWLANYGITKQWVNNTKFWTCRKLALNKIGISCKPCRCPQRQEKINSLWFDLKRRFQRNPKPAK